MRVLDTLVSTMQASPTLGITGPKMLYFDQPETIWCAGNRIDWQTGDSVRLRAEDPDDDDAAMRDAVLGRWGKMGPEVTTLCYGKAR